MITRVLRNMDSSGGVVIVTRGLSVRDPINDLNSHPIRENLFGGTTRTCDRVPRYGGIRIEQLLTMESMKGDPQRR